ncbi:unnamed protein product [Cuscuta campestris]|uniref:Uncharacterized protein n=1 Tax=Cuscuta campestris TaxID=132261 RepID=A0A484LHZ8_9ASTE|nr:unnamed protein product [Cuscuta campestris]
MDVQRYLKNLEIIYANEAILQGSTQRCYKCCGYGHIYWICPNEHAVPYEEWAKIKEEASRAEVLIEETIRKEEKKSFNDQFVIVEDISNFQVKDENDIFVKEPDSEVVVEETTLDVIYSKELNSAEYYHPIGEEESYFIFEGYVKQVLTKAAIIFWKLHYEVQTKSGVNFNIGDSLSFPFDPGILLYPCNLPRCCESLRTNFLSRRGVCYTPGWLHLNQTSPKTSKSISPCFVFQNKVFPTYFLPMAKNKK